MCDLYSFQFSVTSRVYKSSPLSFCFRACLFTGVLCVLYFRCSLCVHDVLQVCTGFVVLLTVHKFCNFKLEWSSTFSWTCC